jgi:hypothetical protein
LRPNGSVFSNPRCSQPFRLRECRSILRKPLIFRCRVYKGLRVRSIYTVGLFSGSSAVTVVGPRMVRRAEEDVQSEPLQSPHEAVAGAFRIKAVEVITAESTILRAVSQHAESDDEHPVCSGDDRLRMPPLSALGSAEFSIGICRILSNTSMNRRTPLG